MYIRIQNNVLRYRISKDEANEIICGNTLNEIFCLTINQSLLYSIIPTSENSHFSVTKNDDTQQVLALSINIEQLKNEIDTRPSKTGIFIQKDNQTKVEVYLEVDLKNKPLSIK